MPSNVGGWIYGPSDHHGTIVLRDLRGPTLCRGTPVSRTAGAFFPSREKDFYLQIKLKLSLSILNQMGFSLLLSRTGFCLILGASRHDGVFVKSPLCITALWYRGVQGGALDGPPPQTNKIVCLFKPSELALVNFSTEQFTICKPNFDCKLLFRWICHQTEFR